MIAALLLLGACGGVGAAAPTPLQALLDAAIARGASSLVLPAGVKVVSPAPQEPVRIAPTDGDHDMHVRIEAEKGGPAEITLELATPGAAPVRRSLTIDFLPPVAQEKLDAVPPPRPVATDVLVGAIHCPLWESDRIDLWRGVQHHCSATVAL
jgi:hypothetical protein